MSRETYEVRPGTWRPPKDYTPSAETVSLWGRAGFSRWGRAVVFSDGVGLSNSRGPALFRVRGKVVHAAEVAALGKRLVDFLNDPSRGDNMWPGSVVDPARDKSAKIMITPAGQDAGFESGDATRVVKAKRCRQVRVEMYSDRPETGGERVADSGWVDIPAKKEASDDEENAP